MNSIIEHRLTRQANQRFYRKNGHAVICDEVVGMVLNVKTEKVPETIVLQLSQTRPRKAKGWRFVRRVDFSCVNWRGENFFLLNTLRYYLNSLSGTDFWFRVTKARP